MGTNDKTSQLAKPNRHEDSGREQKKTYEHDQITDNRLVYEVLENVDE